MLDLHNQLGEIPPQVRTFSQVGDLSSLECGQVMLLWAAELISDLLLGQLNSTNCFAYEIGDVDCSSISLLLDGLLTLCKPRAAPIFICVEDGLILHH